MFRWMVPVAWLAACTPESGVAPIGAQQPVPVVDRVEASPVVGGAPLAVPVRTVDALGIPLDGGSATVAVGADEVSVEVDGHGYGQVAVDAVGTATVAGVEVHATGAVWPPVALQRVVPGLAEATHAVPAAGGALVARPGALWWVGIGGQAHRVLSVPEGEVLGGVQAAHLDLDGVVDAAAWVGSRVVLLRGRRGGGVSRGAVIAADGWRPVAVDAGDTDGDSLPDVAVAWVADGGRAALEVHAQVGPWAWEPTVPVDLDSTPVDLAVGDNDGVLAAEITLTDGSGQWVRFAWMGPGRYAQTGPRGPGFDMQLPAGTTVHSGFDYNGDGGDEILLQWPPPDQGGRTMQVWDLVVEDFPAVFALTGLDPRIATRDADGDRQAEIWTLDTQATLRTVSRREGEHRERAVAELPVQGPFAVADRTGDGIPDLLLGEPDGVGWWHGGLVEQADGPWWTPEPPAHPALPVDLAGPLGVLEVDGDPATLEVVGFRSGASTALVAYRMQRGAPDTLEELDLAPASASGGTPLDLAICDGYAYALTEDTLVRIDPGGGGIFLAAIRDVAAERVACGGGRVAVLAGEQVSLRDAALVPLRTENAPGAVDVALVDRGEGPEVVTCATAGCTVVAWPWGAEGQVAVVRGDAEGVRVGDPAEPVDLPGAGEVAVADVDADGHADLLVRDGGRVLVVRSSGEGFGVVEGFHAPLITLPVVADATGDGGGDLLFLDPDGRLVIAGP